MSAPGRNVDPAEVARFDALASRWWDPAGEMGPLHTLNPTRLDYIDERAALAGRRTLDVGCGGGLLSEAMAARGASVVGLDAADQALSVARMHARISGAEIDYRQGTAEELAQAEPHRFEVITCMELLEHVPDPASLVGACARLAAPGGHIFFSTINRTLRAYLLAVVGAEYVLRLIPAGTHDYARFIRPSELARDARASGLALADVAGIHYDPLRRRSRIRPDPGVNYIAWFRAT